MMSVKLLFISLFYLYWNLHKHSCDESFLFLYEPMRNQSSFHLQQLFPSKRWICDWVINLIGEAWIILGLEYHDVIQNVMPISKTCLAERNWFLLCLHMIFSQNNRQSTISMHIKRFYTCKQCKFVIYIRKNSCHYVPWKPSPTPHRIPSNSRKKN